MQVLSPRVFQEAFGKVTEVAWGDSALGSPPAQLQPVLQCSCLQPGTTPSQLHWDKGVGAEHCVVSQFMVVILLQCSLPHPAVRTRPATAGMWAVFQCRLSLCKAATRILSVCHEQSSLWQWSGASYSSWV